MRHAFWLVVIAFSLTALSGGFLSGRAAVPHFPSATSAPSPSGTVAIDPMGGVAQTDELAADEFAEDEAVALDGPGGTARDDATLAIVLIDAGHSQALESPFLSLNVPVTVVIDPDSPAAPAVAKAAIARGDSVYAQAHDPLSDAAVKRLHSRFPHIAGVAVRMRDSGLERDTARALRGAHLALLDEYGENDAARKMAAVNGVRYAARSITIDDHAEGTYVAYMLRQAVHLARGRTAVVMARPFPGTFRAFQDLFTRASRDGVKFARLP